MNCLLRVDGFDWRQDGEIADYNSLLPPVRQEDAQLLKTLKTFTFLASDAVKERGLKRMGEPIARICYYKAELVQKVYLDPRKNTPSKARAWMEMNFASCASTRHRRIGQPLLISGAHFN